MKVSSKVSEISTDGFKIFSFEFTVTGAVFEEEVSAFLGAYVFTIRSKITPATMVTIRIHKKRFFICN
jgi:hypothetical protein